MYPENNTEVKQNAQLKGLILVCILIVVKITLTVSFNIWFKKKYIKPPPKIVYVNYVLPYLSSRCCAGPVSVDPQ